jgi:CheY-like chemotaxis protein
LLLADDSECDAELALHALAAGQFTCDVVVTRDGAEALDCLHRRGEFQSRHPGDPAVVLLDLNMPAVGGLEALRRIRSDERLRTIPVVMLTSSREESDVARSYQLGANGYVVKPGDFSQYVSALQGVGAFWTIVNEPPPGTFAGPADGASAA